MRDQNLGTGKKGIPYVKMVIGIIVLIIMASTCGKMFVTVGADEIVIMQNPVNGKLTYWTQPGLYGQWFGTLTRYKKSTDFSFSAAHDQGDAKDQSIKVRFNDGGHANISGTLRFDMPVDEANLNLIQSRFGSPEAVKNGLIRTVVEKAVYMTGPLMSSKESAAERRSDLITDIEDQVTLGVYKTESEDVKTIDPLSGKEKTVTIVKLKKDPKAPNGIQRQEASPLKEFGVRAYNFNINGITYDKDVEAQISEQQKMLMQVQTAMARAKEAEQKAITAEKEGQAEAAKAKWLQEVEKAKAVTLGQQQLEVAQLAVKTAEETKKKDILLGEGEAARKKLAMTANGALEQKLAAWVEVQKAYAAEIGKQRWVPEVVMGGGSSGTAGTDFMNLLQAKAARELALDMRMAGTPAPVGKK